MPQHPTANIARLNQLMDQAKLQALVLRSGQNFSYLSGVIFPGTLARLQDLSDSQRAVLLVWPREGQPVILANNTAAGLARRDAVGGARVELYEGYVESPYDKLAEVLAHMKLERVGFESSYINERDWQIVRHAMPQLEMTDCTALMDRVRAIKTPAEVEMLRRAADLLDDVFLEVFQRIRPGDTERKVHADMIGTCLARGFEWAHGILNTNKNMTPYAGESDVVISPGDVIRTDYVAYLDGYPGHQSRCAVVGEPTQSQRDEYGRYLEIYRGAIDRCRAGVKVDDVYRFVMDGFARHGWEYTTPLIGHGVGVWWHQQEPILRRGAPDVLEEGMVLAIEPRKDAWHVQDMILVQQGAPVLLSAKLSTDEVFVVPV